MVALLSHAFCSETYGWPEVRPCANEDDGPSAGGDTSYDLRGTSKKGESVVEVDDGDTGADTVGVWNEVRVHTGFGMAEVSPGRDEGRKCDVRGRNRSVEGMMGLECVIPVLS